MRFASFLFLFGVLIFATNCSVPFEEEEETTLLTNGVLVPAEITDALCPPDSLLLTDGCNDYGQVYLLQKPDSFTVYFIPTSNWLIAASYLYVGPEQNMPLTWSQAPDVHQFTYQTTSAEPVQISYYTVALSDLDSCFRIVPYVELVQLDSGDESHVMNQAEAWAGSIEHTQCGYYAYEDYCLPECVDDSSGTPDTTCTINPNDFRTQTQGGWGSTPSGNNPGNYLHTNFSSAFPWGITIGCNFTITLSSATAVTDFVPQGGSPVSITQNYTDPTTSISVFAGQITALTLSVEFDQYDPSFSNSSTLLKDLVIGSGPLSGQTVEFVLIESNKVLGGCISSFLISDLNDALSMINQNFIDGTTDNGYLICP
ncbi:MAG: hypothetical protein JKY42_01645 [Flavobacteriales bacterium]|nr:hypothetical protein [Flavobacteriales bacterium]